MADFMSHGRSDHYSDVMVAEARCGLEQMEKPDVNLIDGLSPAISIELSTRTPKHHENRGVPHALGVDRVEGERRLPRARPPGD
jgi:excinuclease UvrABC ATPase subunit